MKPSRGGPGTNQYRVRGTSVAINIVPKNLQRPAPQALYALLRSSLLNARHPASTEDLALLCHFGPPIEMLTPADYTRLADMAQLGDLPAFVRTNVLRWLFAYSALSHKGPAIHHISPEECWGTVIRRWSLSAAQHSALVHSALDHHVYPPPHIFYKELDSKTWERIFQTSIGSNLYTSYVRGVAAWSRSCPIGQLQAYLGKSAQPIRVPDDIAEFVRITYTREYAAVRSPSIIRRNAEALKMARCSDPRIIHKILSNHRPDTIMSLVAATHRDAVPETVGIALKMAALPNTKIAGRSASVASVAVFERISLCDQTEPLALEAVTVHPLRDKAVKALQSNPTLSAEGRTFLMLSEL